MNLARIVATAIVSMSLLGAACGASRQPQAKTSSMGGVEPIAARVAQQAPVASFSGDGNTCRTTGACSLGGDGHSVLTGSFHLNPGIAIIRAKDTGGSVFWVGLIESVPGVDPLDTVGGSAIQAIAPFDGAGWLAVDGGDYFVAITAYGGYQISVEQPDASTPATSQRSFTGTGTQVTPFMTLSAGTYTMTANSTGDLYIQLVDLNGNVVPADDGSAGPNYLQLGTSGANSKTFTIVLGGAYMLSMTTTSTETKTVNWTVAVR